MLRYTYHYDVREPHFNTALPLADQIQDFLDTFFSEFSKPGNMMIIYFEGHIQGRGISDKASLYQAFLEVIHDYTQNSKADSLLVIHTHYRFHLKKWLEPMETRTKLQNSQILVFEAGSVRQLSSSLNESGNWVSDSTDGLASYMQLLPWDVCTLHPSVNGQSKHIVLRPLSANRNIDTLQS